MLPDDYANELVDAEYFDFEDLINNNSYWDSCNAVHKLSETKDQAKSILRNEVILKLVEWVFSNIEFIERQKSFLTNDRKIIK